MAEVVQPTKFQQAVLRFRGHCAILNAGGRGSGKSFSLILDLLSHCRDFGADAKPLVLRETHAGLQELRSEIYELAQAAFGVNTSLNKAEGAIYLPTGGVIAFSNIGDENSYGKLQGRSFTGLYADEVGNYPPQSFAFMRRVMSNLRVAPGRRPSIHMTANPHGRSHTVLFKEYISTSPPWHPFDDRHGMQWVWTTSNLTDNPHIDRVTYEKNLRVACGSDDKLAEAWIHGDWSVLGGVMFDTFDPAVHVVRRPPYYQALHHIGGDWGSAAPAVAVLIAELRDAVGPYRPGDFIVLDETHTADPNDLSVGNGAPPAMFADMVKELLNRNGVRRARMTMDDARRLQGETVNGLMKESGLHAHRPRRKDRVGTWNLIRQLLHNAATGEGQALFITDRCPYLLETLPEAPRGTLRAEDLDPKWQRDHALDALGYGLQWLRSARVKSGRVTGLAT